MAVLDQGKLVAEGKVQDLLFADEATLITACNVSAETKAQIEGLASDVKLEDGMLTARVVDEGNVFQILHIVHDAGAKIVSVGQRRRRFEEAFLELTGMAVPDELAEEPAATGGVTQ